MAGGGIPLTNIDLHILIGQSNMEGRADMANLPVFYQGALTNVKIWGGSSFANMNSTLNNNQYPSQLNQFGPEFGYLLPHANRQLTDQYCVKYALGSTGLYPGSSAVTADNPSALDWSPSTGGLYTNLITELTAAKAWLNSNGFAPRIKSILWIQGERDSNNETWANAYAANLEDLFFTNLIPDLSAIDNTVNASTLPVIIHRIHSGFASTYLSTVRAAQYTFKSNHTNVYIFDTDFFPLKSGDPSHFDWLGQIYLGQNALALLRQNFALNEDWMASNPTSITVTDPADSITISNGSSSPALGFINAHSGTVTIQSNNAIGPAILATSGQVSMMGYFGWVNNSTPQSAHIFSLYKNTTNWVRMQSGNTADGSYFRLIIQIAGVNVYDLNVTAGSITSTQLIKITYDYSNSEIKFWYFSTTTGAWVQLGTTQTYSLATSGEQLYPYWTATDSATHVGGTSSFTRKLFLANSHFSSVFPL